MTFRKTVQILFYSSLVSLVVYYFLPISVIGISITWLRQFFLWFYLIVWPQTFLYLITEWMNTFFVKLYYYFFYHRKFELGLDFMQGNQAVVAMAAAFSYLYILRWAINGETDLNAFLTVVVAIASQLVMVSLIVEAFYLIGSITRPEAESKLAAEQAIQNKLTRLDQAIIDRGKIPLTWDQQDLLVANIFYLLRTKFGWNLPIFANHYPLHLINYYPYNFRIVFESWSASNGWVTDDCEWDFLDEYTFIAYFQMHDFNLAKLAVNPKKKLKKPKLRSLQDIDLNELSSYFQQQLAKFQFPEHSLKFFPESKSIMKCTLHMPQTFLWFGFGKYAPTPGGIDGKD